MFTVTDPPYSSASRNRDEHSASSRNKLPKRTNVSAFKNAENIRIKNSSLTVSNTTIVNNVSGDISITDSVLDQALKQLHNKVAPNAILNAGGRAAEVKCYPGTREEVIGLIERWMDLNAEGCEAPDMMWLSGPAGAGKSAIVQTVAERCKERGVQAASFFFFRSSNCIPPHALESTARRPIVLLIDGLDECDSDSERKTPQRQILRALDHILMQANCPFLVLVSSRAESHITMAVRECASLQSIYLDDQYRPEEDIRVFVAGEFNRIRLHPLAHTLSNDWPCDSDIESIVEKSSGQFIYAATVMRFLANSSASPKLSLKRVQGIVPIATNSPFAHLIQFTDGSSPKQTINKQ
ncbi:hypothetical protein D9619_005897 [Psilocybe cf. subviscida]|uniref:Nephrocystin 3-like N-terminal domain-containing protein n=1 Tax=Psilocybe cf. subviscida TaxID=2480587 RepID=A0A8H5BWZ1_9AGAR|nr:hypothetical protein D9619_005897 [Psilocybe cf. subviscida]